MLLFFLGEGCNQTYRFPSMSDKTAVRLSLQTSVIILFTVKTWFVRTAFCETRIIRTITRKIWILRTNVPETCFFRTLTHTTRIFGTISDKIVQGPGPSSSRPSYFPARLLSPGSVRPRQCRVRPPSLPTPQPGPDAPLPQVR